MTPRARVFLMAVAASSAVLVGALAADACSHTSGDRGRTPTANVTPVTEDYRTTHLVTVPVSLTKLLTDKVKLLCGVCSAANNALLGFAAPRELSVDTTGQVSATETFRLRVADRMDRPLQGALKVGCWVEPSAKSFVIGDPPTGDGAAAQQQRRQNEYIRSGATIGVEATFP